MNSILHTIALPQKGRIVICGRQAPACSQGSDAMRVGRDDAKFFTNALLIVFLGAVSAVGIYKTVHSMKNVTFAEPAVVQAATALPR